jgi:hypothetical protein
MEVNRLKKGCNERDYVWHYTRGKQGNCCTEITPVMPARPSSKRKLVAGGLQLRKKHGKTSVRVRKTSVRIRKTSVRLRKTSVRIRKTLG